MTEKIKKMIESMTIDEMKQRLADYLHASSDSGSQGGVILYL